MEKEYLQTFFHFPKIPTLVDDTLSEKYIVFEC